MCLFYQIWSQNVHRCLQFLQLFPEKRFECRGDVLSTRSIFVETTIMSPTLNFLGWFFGFGLPFHCCTFLDF